MREIILSWILNFLNCSQSQCCILYFTSWSPADLQIGGPAFQKPVSPSELSRIIHLLQRVLFIIIAYLIELNKIATYIYDKLHHKTFWKWNYWKTTSLKCYPNINKIPSTISEKKMFQNYISKGCYLEYKSIK